MSESDLSAAHEVVQSIARILETGQFSDLTLTCCEHKFHVHKAIVCARSPVWAAAVGGEFKESRTNLIEVEVVDAVTLKRALTYLYTGVYDDENNALTFAKEPVQSGETDPHEQASASMQQSHAEAQPVETQTEDSHQHEPQKATGITNEFCHNCQAAVKDELDTTCMNTKLQANAFVYVFADYYQIPELKRTAVSKFKAALKNLCANGLGDVCRIVYEDAPPNAFELRSLLSNAISSRGQLLVEDTPFIKAALLLPELLRDVLSDVVRQYRIASSERDDAIIEDLKQEEVRRQRVANAVNESARCTRYGCGLQNNIRLRPATSILGVRGYYIRCKCGAMFDCTDLV